MLALQAITLRRLSIWKLVCSFKGFADPKTNRGAHHNPTNLPSYEEPQSEGLGSIPAKLQNIRRAKPLSGLWIPLECSENKCKRTILSQRVRKPEFETSPVAAAAAAASRCSAAAAAKACATLQNVEPAGAGRAKRKNLAMVSYLRAVSGSRGTHYLSA